MPSEAAPLPEVLPKLVRQSCIAGRHSVGFAPNHVVGSIDCAIAVVVAGDRSACDVVHGAVDDCSICQAELKLQVVSAARSKQVAKILRRRNSAGPKHRAAVRLNSPTLVERPVPSFSQPIPSVGLPFPSAVASRPEKPPVFSAPLALVTV